MVIITFHVLESYNYYLIELQSIHATIIEQRPAIEYHRSTVSNDGDQQIIITNNNTSVMPFIDDIHHQSPKTLTLFATVQRVQSIDVNIESMQMFRICDSFSLQSNLDTNSIIPINAGEYIAIFRPIK